MTRIMGKKKRGDRGINNEREIKENEAPMKASSGRLGRPVGLSDNTKSKGLDIAADSKQRREIKAKSNRGSVHRTVPS